MSEDPKLDTIEIVAAQKENNNNEQRKGFNANEIGFWHRRLWGGRY